PKQKTLDQVVRHGTLCGYLFNLEGDGVRLVDSHPDRENTVAAHILQDHDGHIRDRIHHQAANFHFEFHCAPSTHITPYSAGSLRPASSDRRASPAPADTSRSASRHRGDA